MKPLLVLSLLLIGYVHNALAQRQRAPQPFVFPVNKNAEFSVMFPAKPTLKRSSQSPDSLVADLVLNNEMSRMTAAYIALSPDIAASYTQMDDVQLAEFGGEIASDLDLPLAEIPKTEHTPFGRRVVARGYQTPRLVELQIEVFVYFGKESVAIITGIAPSNIYPTPSIVKFYKSFQRNDAIGSTRNANFVDLKLPFNASLKVPKTWRVFDIETNAALETAAEAQMNLSGIPTDDLDSVTLFRANSTPASTYAGVSVKVTTSVFNEKEAKTITDAELREFSSELQRAISAANKSFEILSYEGIKQRTVSVHPAWFIEYRRSGLNGSVLVRMVQVFIGSKTLQVMLSYRESESQIWKPIIDYMQQSLTVGTSPPRTKH